MTLEWIAIVAVIAAMSIALIALSIWMVSPLGTKHKEIGEKLKALEDKCSDLENRSRDLRRELEARVARSKRMHDAAHDATRVDPSSDAWSM